MRPPFSLEQLFDMYASGFAVTAICTVLPLAAAIQRLGGFQDPNCETARYATRCYIDVMKEAVESFENPKSFSEKLARSS